MFSRKTRKTNLPAVAVVIAGMLVMGQDCTVAVNPGTDTEYDRGFADGFALDEWYWSGYDDGYDMIDFLPILYDAAGIPDPDTPPYTDGFWDGVWTAYNDGYFVDYRYAFILGFSEGYDNAFWPDYLDFLAQDRHTEFNHGGWIDGYDDGFSEGRVFGANDFEQGLPFDWQDALLDYESGTDLFFDEIGVGTGEFGPVFLYEYGTDPNTFIKSLRGGATHAPPSVRGGNVKGTGGDDLYRPLTSDAEAELNVLPPTSLRSERQLRLNTTWLERVNAYLTLAKSDHEKSTGRARAKAVPEN